MLTKVLFGVCAVLAVGLAVCFIYAKRQKASAAKYKKQAEANEEAINSLNMVIDRMKAEAVIKSENRKEADEKVEKLHHGDALDNALNGLHKHD